MDAFDVVVIGGGAAGTGAALSAADAGARVALVHRGPGAAALSGGAWRNAPPDPIARALTAAGYGLAPCDGPLPHPDGRLVPAAVAASSHARAALRPGDGGVLVCGIAGLPAFHAASLAALWADEAGIAGGLEAVTLTLDGTPAAGWSPVALAAALDTAPDLLPTAVARLVRERGAERVILPAILGLEDHARVMAAFMSAGMMAGEALGGAPSIPGWRLDRALRRAVSDAGVHVITGRVVGSDAAGGIVRSIRIDGARGRVDAAATCFVLATGKYIAGGITAHVEFEEPALGCDVALERFARTIDDPGAALILTDPDRMEPQPALTAGVRVDTEGRPLTPAGDVFLMNVFTAGSVRAGRDAATLGLGAAMHEGSEAGTRAAACASFAGRV